MKTKGKKIIFFFILCLLSLNACNSDRMRIKEEPLLILVEMDKTLYGSIGEEIAIPYTTILDTPQEGDLIVFQKSFDWEYDCPVVRVDKDYFYFRLDEEILTGKYKMILRRGARELELGEVLFLYIPRNNLDPKEGFDLYGQVVCDGKGVPDVVISDGIETTLTDERGVYYLPSNKKYSYVWMSIPSGYEALNNGVLPLFCKGLHAPVGTPERNDFELVKADNDRFTLYILGDMHLARKNQDLKQFDQFAQDLNRTIDETPGKEYALTLGDMTWDVYWYTQRFSFTEYVQLINNYFHDIPFFHTMGNHDNDYEQFGDFNKEIPYRKHLTPTFYSYNIGQIHFIVLDNIDYNETGAGTSLRSLYLKDITSDQMDWLRKDLSYVDKSTPIVLSTHAPLFYPTEEEGWVHDMTGANAENEANTQELVDAFQGYTVHFFTGHTHKTFVYDQMEEHHFIEHNAGSLCGSWWWSGNLTPGINLAQDGAPGGYTILQVNGKEMEWVYKSTGYPIDYQFRAYDMNEVKKSVRMSTGFNHPNFEFYYHQIQDHGDNLVLLNIWNYDPKWKIEVSENGLPVPVKEVFDYDPLHIIAMTAKRFETTDKPSFLTQNWNHFFEIQTSSPTSTLTIKVTDRFGNVSSEVMSRPKPFNTDIYQSPDSEF